jgi:hypothetical protein
VLTIVLAIVPPNDEPHKGIAIAKVIGSTFLLVGAGVGIFIRSFWKRSGTTTVILCVAIGSLAVPEETYPGYKANHSEALYALDPANTCSQVVVEDAFCLKPHTLAF